MAMLEWAGVFDRSISWAIPFAMSNREYEQLWLLIFLSSTLSKSDTCTMFVRRRMLLVDLVMIGVSLMNRIGSASSSL